MSNPNDPTNYNSEVRKDSYTDANGNTESHVTRSTETGNSNSYRDGYVDGRVTESGYKEENLIERDENNSARGMLFGILLASLAALGAGAVWYFNQPKAVDNTPTTVVVPVPTNTTPSPAAIQTPQPQQTTIIERTKEVPVPVLVPQQQAAPPTVQQKPQINITVPPQPAPTKTAPATKSDTTSQPATKSDSTSEKVTKTNTTTTTTSPTTKSDTTTSPNTQSDTSTTLKKSTTKSNSTSTLPSASDSSSPDGSTK
jgi:type IV secretory pathway VirB10-like protein